MSSPKKHNTYRKLFLRIEAAVNDSDALHDLEDEARNHPRLDAQQRGELGDRARQYRLDIQRAKQAETPTAEPSLEFDLEHRPEKYPSLRLKKSEKGRWHVTFLGRPNERG